MTTLDQRAPTQLEERPPNEALGNLSFIRKEMTQKMDEIARIADRSASSLLLGLGSTILIFAFLFKLNLLGQRISELAPSEFITALIVSMVLLLAGAGMRVFQFLKQEEAGKLVRESGIALLSKSIDTAATIATHGTPTRTGPI